ncbi:MAG: hypothetical protein WCK97_08615 [Actinomycetes bacterium]|jgi:hypothetical protein
MTTAGAEPGHIDVGKVLTDTANVLKASFATVWMIALILFIPVAILGHFAKDSWIIYLIYAIASVVAYLYMAGIVVRVVQDVEADGRVDASVGDLFGSITPKLWPLLILSIVTGILVFVGYLFFIIPGIILTLVLFVAVPAMIAEDLGVFGSMSRSNELTRSNRWRLILLGIVIYLMLVLIAVVILIFTLITPILGDIAGVLIAIVVYPYIAIIVAVTYYELLEARGESKPGPGVATSGGEMPA